MEEKRHGYTNERSWEGRGGKVDICPDKEGHGAHYHIKFYKNILENINQINDFLTNR